MAKNRTPEAEPEAQVAGDQEEYAGPEETETPAEPAAETPAARRAKKPEAMVIQPGMDVRFLDFDGKKVMSAVIRRVDGEMRANLDVFNANDDGVKGTFQVPDVEHDPTGKKPRSWRV